MEKSVIYVLSLSMSGSLWEGWGNKQDLQLCDKNRNKFLEAVTYETDNKCIFAPIYLGVAESGEDHDLDNKQIKCGINLMILRIFVN